MYRAVGTSDEITKLVTQFLPAQVDNALQNGFNPQVYACEALGLAFAFGNETGGTGFATDFGPSAPGLPSMPAGDAAFAAEAAVTIFGSAATANTVGAIEGFVTNWKAFYTSNGLPGVPNATGDQIDLAARGAAWVTPSVSRWPTIWVPSPGSRLSSSKTPRRAPQSIRPTWQASRPRDNSKGALLGAN
jgi:hypothetical protein